MGAVLGALRGLQLEGGRDGTWELAREGGRGETERGEEGGSSCLSRRALCMHLNTSLSNLSTCQQHMFGKKRERAVGRREKRVKKKIFPLPVGVMAPTRALEML